MPDAFSTGFSLVWCRGKKGDFGDRSTGVQTEPLPLSESLGKLLPVSFSFEFVTWG